MIGLQIVKMIKHPAMEEVYRQGISVDAEDSELVSELLTRFRVFARGMSESGFYRNVLIPALCHIYLHDWSELRRHKGSP